MEKGRVKHIWISFSENALGHKKLYIVQSLIRINSHIKQAFIKLLPPMRIRTRH